MVTEGLGQFVVAVARQQGNGFLYATDLPAGETAAEKGGGLAMGDAWFHCFPPTIESSHGMMLSGWGIVNPFFAEGEKR